MARKLASIQRILKLESIEGADKIVKATILGWQCVVGKEQFKEGDMCVYIEIDSIVPNTESFQFLKGKSTEDKWRRIRTRRFKGCIAQGLAMPLSVLDNLQKSEMKTNNDGSQYELVINTKVDIVEGADVTDVLEIEKYEPKIPAHLMGTIKGSFPSFIPKTDETRVQVLQDVITRHKGTECYVTEKVDGSSCTIYLNKCSKCDGCGIMPNTIPPEPVKVWCDMCKGTGKEFGVCSRNVDLKEDDNNEFWKVVRKLDIEKKMRNNFERSTALQGELIGPGIQSNPLKLDESKILFFNIFDIEQYKYYNFGDFLQHIVGVLGLETVPIIYDVWDNVDYWVLIDDINELVKLATRKSLINPKVWAEGIVIRPMNEKMDLQMSSGFGNGRLSFKVINPEYLLINE